MITNSSVENTFKIAIIKWDVSDHFPICISIPSTNVSTKNDVIYQYKRTINDEKLKIFFKISINLNGIPSKPIRMQMKRTIISYEHFVQFIILFFPMNKTKIKTKYLESCWITTKGIKNL